MDSGPPMRGPFFFGLSSRLRLAAVICEADRSTVELSVVSSRVLQVHVLAPPNSVPYIFPLE